ncbi:hypothetical protein BCR32DRAFT_23506 [Anaeromyces robustus]|uniref:CLASP N-terminal domain-containing protein n=1 Tax=Anaeromyces robustus TaxID=1754192 RepID=A0A1Y1XMC4_9FUNG|nr:hypothetical protein BCR32DRAFT_23506 [Anaeromyces robustus]|eukprot:ORX86882.1 hypothetical protein BCR32DRAFT_23506 [Anaeromyces robustus]
MVTLPNYNDILKSFSGPILNSINSERGALSKTALEVVGEIACLMKFNFESFIDIFLPTIINITGKANNIFTQSGLSCIKKIIINTNSTKIIPQLYSHKNDKKKKIRLVVAECIETCLFSISNKKLYDYIYMIEQLIKDGIYDREQIIRDTYKRVYMSFKNTFNENILKRFEMKLSKEDIKRLGIDIYNTSTTSSTNNYTNNNNNENINTNNSNINTNSNNIISINNNNSNNNKNNNNNNNNNININNNNSNILNKNKNILLMKTPKVEKNKIIINPSIIAASEKKNSLNLFNVVPSTPAILRQDNPYFQQTYSTIKKSLFFNRIPDIMDNDINIVHNKNQSNNLLNFFLNNTDDLNFKNNIDNNTKNDNENENNNDTDNTDNDSNSMEIEDNTFINSNNNNIKNTDLINEDSYIMRNDEITILNDNNDNLEEIFKSLLKQISSLDTIDKDKAFNSLSETVENCDFNDIIQNQGYIMECIKFGFVEDNSQIVLQSLTCLEKIVNCKLELQKKKDNFCSSDNINLNNNIMNSEIKLDDSIMSRLALILSDFKNNNTIINKTLGLMENIFKDNPLEFYLSILLDKALEYDLKIKKILIELVEKLIIYTFNKIEINQELNIDTNNKFIGASNEKENKVKEKINPYLMVLIKKIKEVDTKQRVNLVISFINIVQAYPLKINLVRFLQIYINFSNEIHIRRRLQHFAVILCRDNTINSLYNSKNNDSDKPIENEIIKIPNSIILFEAINSLIPSQKRQIKIILNKDIPNFDEIERNQKQLKVKLNALKQRKSSQTLPQQIEKTNDYQKLYNEPEKLKSESFSVKTTQNTHVNKRSKTSLTTSKISSSSRLDDTNLIRKKSSNLQNENNNNNNNNDNNNNDYNDNK